MIYFPLTRISYKLIDIYYTTYYITNVILKIGSKNYLEFGPDFTSNYLTKVR